MKEAKRGGSGANQSNGATDSMESNRLAPDNLGMPTMPIAIVGMSCRFPGDVTSPEKLWKLCTEARSAWSEVPMERFNQSAFYHPHAEKLSTTNVRGGHFLSEDVSLFDASFFNFSSEVAATMDPQFRLQLETVFEAFESAGMSLEELAGSETSVFAGAFFRDHHDSLMRDPETLPRYFMTGNGAAMAANRISHFFDLRGPSITIDTGCSTALAALHLACQSLRTGDARISVVGGANIMLNPDMFVSMSTLGFLSPDGKSYAFDSRANGYGRGEGVATIVIKPLCDALRDNDPIQAVIRETALNQDGKTPTLTSPSQEAQEELIRTCYRNAGLDPLHTSYVEAHGTGTQAGDPVEAGAIGKVFGHGRPSDQPLYIGSVKTNIGHTEAASGLAAVIKAAMAVGKGYIPPSVNFEKPNAKVLLEQWKLKVPRNVEQWPLCDVRRASISNFGYGGTNAHVIIEDAHYIPSRRSLLENGIISNGTEPATEKWRLFTLTARDEAAARAMIKNLRDYLRGLKIEHESHFLQDLAYTLGQRRSIFPWVSCMPAKSLKHLSDTLDSDAVKPSRASKAPRIGFVFTGQGAQWHAMGRELISAYPVFRSTLVEADMCLKDLGSTLSLIDELTRTEQTSRVNEPAMSLVLCTAVQLSLVRLLQSWGIEPSAVTSHSSGEVAAAFAAGALDLESAMAIVHLRGTLTTKVPQQDRTPGGMIAVGLGRSDADAYISQLESGKVVVACVNSPSSVTVSGDLQAINELEASLTANGIFARKLKVQVAYHSHHMLPFSEDYLAALHKVLKPVNDFGPVIYSSPVTGGRIDDGGQIVPEHWLRNMVQPVLFSDSFRNMCLGSVPGLEEVGSAVDMVIEVGPHSALAGPIRQILMLSELKSTGISYGSCLTRGQNAVESMLNLSSLLLARGYRVNLDAINFPMGRHNVHPIPDLPSYPWTHTVSHWTEPRVNRAHRRRLHAYHDLLGSQSISSTPLVPTWRHIIRATEVPWIRDHQVQSSIVYPGAGFICMAIEAVRQVFESDEGQIAEYALRDIDIMLALIIPDTPEGAEIHLALRSSSEKSLMGQEWREFHIYSVGENDSWKEHCTGLISVKFKSSPSSSETEPGRVLQPTNSDHLEKRIDPNDIYQSLRSVGIYHGPAFQNLSSIKSGHSQSVSEFAIADTASVMPCQYEQDHVLHPTTLDSIFQAVYSALPSAGSQTSAMVPKTIRKMRVSNDVRSKAGDSFKAYSTLHSHTRQGFQASVTTVAGADDAPLPVVEIDRLYCQSLGSMLASEGSVDKNNLCMTMRWERDLSFMQPKELKETLKLPADPAETKVIQDMKKAVCYFARRALKTLTKADEKNFSWHQRSFYSWLKLQNKLANLDLLGPDSSSWATESELTQQMLLDSVSRASANGEMLCRIGNNLQGVLRNEIAPLELMLEGRLLYTYYEKDIRMQRSYSQVKELVKLFAHKYPRAKVLEIGAGTGGCTSAVLHALGGGHSGVLPSFTHYEFTDISSGFFEKAREKYGAWGNLVTYKKLDIENSPAAQGFENGSYDLIVACRVLHATKTMDNTMRNVRRLLKLGGKLLLVEDTRDALDTQMVFGVLPGWWLSEEVERKLSPTLNIEAWQRLFRQTGFNGLDLEVHDREDSENYSSSVILTSADGQESPEVEEDVVLVYGNSAPSQAWLSDLTAALKRFSSRGPTVEKLDLVDPQGKICIVLDEVDQVLLEQPTAHEYQILQRLLTTAKGVLWVSRGGAMDCPRPQVSLHTGLLRTLRCENIGKTYISLDLDPARDPWTTASTTAIVKVFTAGFDDSKDKSKVDFEYAERNGLIYAPRISPDQAENAAVAPERVGPADKELEMQLFRQPGHPLRLEVGTPGLIDSFYFKSDPEAMEPLPKDFVEIEPAAFGLNFRDIMVAMGQLDVSTMGFECSGVVTQLGSEVSTGLKAGDRVCALIRGHWSNSVRVHWTSVARIPDDMSFEVAASVPMVFITAYCSLFDTARLRKGESVLIHAAAGGVGQAAIILAQHVGAEIFATVGSQKKREFLMSRYNLPAERILSSRDTSFAADIMSATAGKGVDVILNSLTGQLLQETWECIARFGRFVEIGKRDLELNRHLEMRPFTRSVTFSAIDLIQLGTYDGPAIARVLADVIRLLGEGAIRPVGPITTFPVQDLEKAFRLMQTGRHVGKIVITPSESDLVKVLPSKPVVRLFSESSYLIVGGVGGIGRSIANYLVEHGARHLILVSRKAASKPDLYAFARKLRTVGCQVAVHNCDIANAVDLATLLEKCHQEMPPIRGVIQAAMVLQDSIFETMTFENYNMAIRPKVVGSWNLHHQLRKADLDFFVMLSSFAAVGGNSSQSNYAAGGTYQDALARHRAASGLPAVVIDLGMVKSVGYVAETKGVAERLIRMGYRPLEEEEVLRLVESAIRTPLRSPQACQVITGIDAGFNGDLAGVPWRLEPRFSGMTQVDSSQVASQQTKDSAVNIKDHLSCSKSLSEAVEVVCKAIVTKLSEMFMIPEAEIDQTLPMARFGVDSLVAVELRNWLAAQAQAETSIFDVMQASSLAALARTTAAKSKFVSPQLLETK